MVIMNGWYEWFIWSRRWYFESLKCQSDVLNVIGRLGLSHIKPVSPSNPRRSPVERHCEDRIFERTVYFQRKDRIFSKFKDHIFSHTIHFSPKDRIFPVLGLYIFSQDRIFYLLPKISHNLWTIMNDIERAWSSFFLDLNVFSMWIRLMIYLVGG